MRAWVAFAGLAVLLSAVPSLAQVYIPPPDDLVLPPVVMEPNAPPPLGSPGAPPPTVVAPMTIEEARAEAKATGSSVRGSYQDLPLRAGAAGEIPLYQDVEPSQTSYYDDPTGLPAAGAGAAYTSEAFQTANDSGRPVVNVTRADISRAVAIEKDPAPYLDGEALTGTAGECVPLPPGSGSSNYAEYTCNVGSAVVDQQQTCSRALNVTEWTGGTIYQYLCVTGVGYDSCPVLVANSQCTKTASYPIPEYSLMVDYYDCSQQVIDPNIYLYGTLTAAPPPGAFEVTQNVYRCNNDGLTAALTTDVLGLPNGYVSPLQDCTPFAGNALCTKTSVAATGLTDRTLCKTWEFFGDPFFGGTLVCTEFGQPEDVYQCSQLAGPLAAELSVSKWFTESWVDGVCSVDLGSCTFTGETCTGGINETRIVAGVPVSRACWEYSKIYQCQVVVGGGSDCGPIEANPSCTLDHEVCLDDPPSGGPCVVSEKVYRCPIPGTTPEPAQYICGDDVYCINGDCEPIVREASDEFKEAVVALNALGQASAEFDENTLTLFKGTAEKCSHKLFGLSNCCSGSGVPLLTPFLCSAAEQNLDKLDDAGLCHKVGTYCSAKFLGICTTKKDSYCCFQSKISRILQEQGRPQIGKSWGTPNVPVCTGFTIFEFQQLDLAVMDFSEIYAEFEDAVRLPDEAAALIDIKAKIEAYYASH